MKMRQNSGTKRPAPCAAAAWDVPAGTGSCPGRLRGSHQLRATALPTTLRGPIPSHLLCIR